MSETVKDFKLDQHEIQEFLSTQKSPEPEFQFEIAWSDTFEHLIEGEHSSRTSSEELLTRARATGRVLLAARGGGAKTILVNRLARELVEVNVAVALIPLRRWTDLDYKKWSSINGHARRIDYLFDKLTVGQQTAKAMLSLPGYVDKMILVDGLNEVTYDVGEQILEAFDQYLTYASGTGIIITDRLVRRDPIWSERWNFATISPLSEQEIARLIAEAGVKAAPESYALLSSPFFLDAVLHGKPGGRTEAEILENRLLSNGLNGEDIDRLSAFAYKAYEEQKSRMFRTSALSEAVGSQVVSKLRNEGDLRSANDDSFFDHHLLHDYLAARYVSSQPAKSWGYKAFNALTLGASSFDALSLALQHIEDSEKADEFVRTAYDWNLYGAAYAVTEGRYMGPDATAVSAAMEFVVLAMLAIRRWDIIESTRRKATDALRLFPIAEAKRFLSATSQDDVYKIVQLSEWDQSWFTEWKDIFLAQKLEIDDASLGVITGTDSIKGWTLANTLKRMDVPKAFQAVLRDTLARDKREVIRWRIAHLLGRFPTSKNVNFLLHLLDQEKDDWVLYGATRSLIEMAARAKKTKEREYIFREMQKRVALLRSRKKAIAEFEAAIFVADAPEGWLDSLRPIIETLYIGSQTAEERDHWRRVAGNLEERYLVD